MELPQVLAVLITTAAVASYLNYRFLHLASAIGLMAISLLISIGLMLAAKFTAFDVSKSFAFILSIDFSNLLLHGMLPYLLFAGALHVDARELRNQAWPVAVLPTVGVAIATLLIGTLFWLAAGLFGLELSFLQGLLFGALIAPTDPIAVLGILRQAGVPKSLEAMIAGESLFNDGVAVVAFLTILGTLSAGESPSAGHIVGFLLIEAAGGIAFGCLIGWVGYRLLRGVDEYPVEIFLTLAVAAGGYAMAEAIGVSAPLAIVAAGLVVGSIGRRSAMSEKTEQQLTAFWEVVDEMLNAILFLLVGLELVTAIDVRYLGLATLSIALVLVGRAISVALPLLMIRPMSRAPKGALTVLTWGGLRGAISLALAMSLPAGPVRDLLLTTTYVIVAFSVLVQGLTLPRVI
ncbi:MAG: sodium:proton antiporter, partial [Betaproteobacteria bacterium]